jgi:hypothetical protein
MSRRHQFAAVAEWPPIRLCARRIEAYLNAAVRATVARLRGEAEADSTIEI